MARSLNKVMLIGNLGKDPEVRHLENGTTVANFPIATTENYKDKSGNVISNTDWHNIVAWRGLAEVVEKYLKKGSKVYLEGKLRTRSWQDKEGNTRYTTEVVLDEMVMLGRIENDSTQQQQVPMQTKTPDTLLEEEDDDLPF